MDPMRLGGQELARWGEHLAKVKVKGSELLSVIKTKVIPAEKDRDPGVRVLADKSTDTELLLEYWGYGIYLRVVHDMADLPMGYIEYGRWFEETDGTISRESAGEWTVNDYGDVKWTVNDYVNDGSDTVKEAAQYIYILVRDLMRKASKDKVRIPFRVGSR